MSGFIFIWLTGKRPAFISWGGQYIIILAEKDLVPFWSPDLERSKEMYGTFDFWRNCFREQCGVYINDRREVVVDVNSPPNFQPTSEPGVISSIRTNIAKHDFEQDSEEEIEQDEENVVISDLIGEQDVDDEPGQTMMVNSEVEQEEEEHAQQ